jgi:uncharacterized damage-inducible protein DinB
MAIADPSNSSHRKTLVVPKILPPIDPHPTTIRRTAMKDLLLDLYGHQAWADAEHWRALEALPVALEDPAIRNRLYHYHLTQRAFLFIVRGDTLSFPRPEEFPTMKSLKNYAKSYHDEALEFVRQLSDSELTRLVVVPWFKDPPMSITVAQAFTQAAMHSHYHRGQNATRLRELGGHPPLSDLIAWYWKGRPAARWE